MRLQSARDKYSEKAVGAIAKLVKSKETLLKQIKQKNNILEEQFTFEREKKMKNNNSLKMHLYNTLIAHGFTEPTDKILQSIKGEILKIDDTECRSVNQSEDVGFGKYDVDWFRSDSHE